MSRSSPSAGRRQSPGSDEASSGQGLGLSWQKRAKSAASALGRMARFALHIARRHARGWGEVGAGANAAPRVAARFSPLRVVDRGIHRVTPGYTCWPPLNLDFGAAHIARALLAEEVDHIGHLIGRAEAPHGDLLLDDLVGAGREDRGIDLAGGDRIDTNAARAEVMGHLAGQRGKGRLRRGVSGARERMDAAAGDRGSR